MSNNQKQAPTGAPQQQPRFTQGSDGFHVTTPPTGFVPQQNQNPPPSQGGSIRGMAPTGPPTQASTPPQSEQIKQMQQQSGQLPMAFVSQTVRQGQSYHYRNPPPNTGGPRMANHHRQVPATNQMYPHVSLYSTPMAQPMAAYQLPMQYHAGNTQRTPYYPTQPFTTMIPGQIYHGSYPAQQPQTPQAAYYSPQYAQPMTIPGRQGPPGPTVPSAPQGATQTQPPVMTAPLNQQPQQKKRVREKAIPIINPTTGKNINEEDESLPTSGDNSARETPQPNSSMQVVAEFAARVAIVASEDKMNEVPEPEPIIFQPAPVQPTLDGELVHKMESVVQNSKLQVSTKEFVPEIKHVPVEESIPIDSNKIESPIVSSPIKIKPGKPQPPKEEDVVFVNQETVHEPQVDVQKVNKANKVVKIEQPKIIEQATKETSPTEDISDKGKRAQQKAKEATSAQTAAAAAAATTKQNTPVPGSQPPKPTSKANKMRELNMKGAIKEGTDMDAFSTPEIPTVNDNCIQNQNQQTQPQIQPKLQSETVLPVADPIIPDTNITPATKPTEIKMMKNKVDVTSIVKDVPKIIKPFVNPIPSDQNTESKDETDRVASEKLVQVKNEANIKANAADANEIDKNLIRYKKDQWSPINTTGKKCYDRDFLLCLKSNPKCTKKPDNLPDLDVVLKDSNRSKIDARAFSMNRQSEVLMPAFHKSLSQRGSLQKRNSQQGKTGSKSGKPNAIHVTLSLKEDVKLRETENAWKPARLNHAATLTEDEVKTAALYKKVRGVLNKLTPEKFEKLLTQVRDLTIDNEERLQGVIDLVFEKAVDEPNFSVAYALMCKELGLMQVPSTRKNKNDSQEYVNFRKLLITRCQLEFEKNSMDENVRNIKLKEIEECTDPEKKKELQLLLEEYDRRMRVKSVGNIRFIGELFKQQMLTVNIMLRCINILLVNKDEDSLECLCKLLTTIGQDLEQIKGQNLSPYFSIMQDIVDKKHGRISSRVRFMLQDVIDLRSSHWIPRRQDLNPKTMEQIQKEADTEQLNIQVMNSGPRNTPRKDDRTAGGNAGGSERKRRNNATDDSGWSMAAPRGRVPYQVESSKLMNKPPPMEEMTLGSKNQFGQWGRGSNIKAQTHTPVTNTTNMYAALENINSDEKTRSNYESRLKDSYVPKGPSMERTGYKQNYEDGRGSRSGSQHRNSQQRSIPSPSVSIKREQQQPPVVSQPSTPQLTPEQMKLKMHNIIEEYLNDCSDLKDSTMDIKQTIDPSKMQEFVTQGYNEVLDCSTTARLKMGKLFAHLITTQVLSIDDYCKSLIELLSLAEDLVIDVPMLWNYLAEMIVPLITENALPLSRLRYCMEVLVAQGHSHKLLAQLLRQLFTENGPGYINEIWQTSGVSFTDFMPAEHVNNFIKDNKFDFMVGGAGTPVMHSSLSWETVHKKLLHFFETDTKFDTITDWITANVGDRVKENQFIRTLVTAMCEYAVYTVKDIMKIKSEKFLEKNGMLLQRYVDSQENHELQCLFALQALIHKWEHPPGLLLTIFEQLWESGYVSNESLFDWETCNDPAEQEGKAIALVSLQRLFTGLKEADEEEDSSEEA